MGIHFFQTATGTLRMVAGTKTGLWQFDGTDWLDITGTALSGGNTNHVRHSTFFQGGVYNVVETNGVNVPKKWDGAAATYTALGGTPGVSIDSTVLANRLLLLQYPNKIRISDFNGYEVYSTDLDLLLIDSGDPMIGMQRINRTAVGVIGEKSQWVLRAQSGAFPVRPERISENPGAVSAAAIIKANSTLFYLAEDFNVYSFDGATPAHPMGWAMLPFVKDNLNGDNRAMTHGIYMEDIHKAFWFFPGQSMGAPNLGIFLDVLTGEMGRLSFANPITASALVRTARVAPVTWASAGAAGLTWDNVAAVYPTWDSVGGSGASERVNVLGDSAGVIHVTGQGDGSDDGAAIECQFEFPLTSYGGWDKNTVPKVYESFFRKTVNSTIVEPSLGMSETLMSDPIYTPLENFDLAVDQRNDVDLSGTGEHRFISLKHRIIAQKGQVEFLGGLFGGEATDIAAGPENQ
jgi:hypothetical protein